MLRLSINIVCSAVVYALFLTTSMSYAAFKPLYLQFKTGSTINILMIKDENLSSIAKSGWHLELSAGYRFNKNFAAELALLNSAGITYIDFDDANTGGESNVLVNSGWLASCYYSFTPDYNISPYIKLGLGRGVSDYKVNESINMRTMGLLGTVGFGAKFNILENVFIDIGYVYHRSMSYRIKILRDLSVSEIVNQQVKATSSFHALTAGFGFRF